MAYILNIETATKNCSLSLAQNGTTLFCKELSTENYSHAEKLHVFIQEVVQESKIEFSELKAIAVSKGPGSYTGLRIGVSAAKGLSYTLEIPLISIDTLQILASKVHISEGFIVPMLDARRMEVYSAIFDANGTKVREVQAEILTEESFSTINDPVFFISDCNEKCKTVLQKSNFHFVEGVNYPSANEMSSLSYKKFIEKDFEDTAYFEPFYLKDFLITAPKKITP